MTVIKVVVKTLDGSDHIFETNTEKGIGTFKTDIADAVSIQADRQRLIFRGHVLKDDKTLGDCGIDNDKVLHLVERPPNISATSNDNPPQRAHALPPENVSIARLQAIIERVLGHLCGQDLRTEVNAVETGEGQYEVRISFFWSSTNALDSPALSRVAHVRQMLYSVNHGLYHLENPDEDVASAGADSHSKCPGLVKFDPLSTCAVHEGDPSSHDTNPARSNDSASATAADSASGCTQRLLHTDTLADVMRDVFNTQARFQPFLQRYEQVLRNDPMYENNETGERQNRSDARFFADIQRLLHSLSHVLHSASDLNIHFCEEPPRHLYPQYPTGSNDNAQPLAEVIMSFQMYGAASPPPVIAFAPPRGRGASAARARATFNFGPRGMGGGVHGQGPQPRMPIINIQSAPRGRGGARFATIGRGGTAHPTMPVFPGMGQPAYGVVMQMGFDMVPPEGGASNAANGGQPQRANITIGSGGMPPNLQQFMTQQGNDPNAAHELIQQTVRSHVGNLFGNVLQQQQGGAARGPSGVHPTTRTRQLVRGRGATPNLGGPMIRGPDGNILPVFVGNETPETLPLFTNDRFLPCASRHFANSANNASQASGGAAAAATGTSTTNEEANTADRVLPYDSPEELTELQRFEREMYFTLRDVVRSFEPLNQSSNNTDVSHSHIGDFDIAVDDDMDIINDNVTTGAQAEQPPGETQEFIRRIMTALMTQSSQSIAELFADQADLIASDGTALNEIMLIVIQHLSIVDVMNLMNAGDAHVLDRLSEPMKRFFCDRFFEGRSNVTEADLREVAEKMADESAPRWQTATENINSDIDLTASITKCFRRLVEDFLKLIFGFTDISVSVGQAMHSRISKCIRQICAILILHTENGRADCEIVLSRFMNILLANETLSNEMVQMMSDDRLRSLIPTMMAASNLTERDIEQFLVEKQQNNVTGQSELEDPEITSDNQTPVTCRSSTTSDEYHDFEDENTTENNVASDPAGIRTSASGGGDDWKSVVPGSWVPVIEKDIERQRMEEQSNNSKRKDSNFSDAYLSGMPSKRKKAYFEDKMHKQEVGGLLEQTLKDVIGQLNVQPITGENSDDVIENLCNDQELSNSFESALKERVNKRLINETDVNSTRFPNVVKYFKQ